MKKSSRKHRKRALRDTSIKSKKAKKQENRKEDREGKKVNETIEWNDKEIIPDQTIYKSFYSFALSLYVSFTFYFLKAL